MTGILSPAVPADVLGEGPPQMPFTRDQQQVGDLDPGGEDEPFRVSVRTGCGAGAARTVRRARAHAGRRPLGRESLPRDVAVRVLQRLAMSAAPATPPGTMRALRFTEFGTPAEALASAQVALPPVIPDESLVQVHAAGITPVK